MNSLARSNASIYGNKDDLYDRLKRHAYPGKKGNIYHLPLLYLQDLNEDAGWVFERE